MQKCILVSNYQTVYFKINKAIISIPVVGDVDGSSVGLREGLRVGTGNIHKQMIKHRSCNLVKVISLKLITC